MKISACYITKNEEKNIRRSIESLQGQADEIIVVDTGSADGTAAAAELLGAQVYYYSWQKDFAAARNFALSKATGDWLIILDADEYFTEETAGNIRPLLEKIDGRYSSVFIQMINWDQDREEVQDKLYQMRLVKNLPGLAYEGVVHEWPHVNGKLVPDPVLVRPNILQIIHTGYSSGVARQKLLRNLALLKDELDRTGNINDLSRYFCITYMALGNVDKGLYYGWQYVRQGRHNMPYAGQCNRAMLGYYAGQRDRQSMQKRFELAAISVEQFPELPDFYAEYGECLFSQGRFREADEQLRLALELWQDYDGLEPCCLSEEARPVMEHRAEMFAQLAARAEKISVSACVICRDEAANIAGWLENVRSFADEIVVVDTGSVDGTKEFLTENNVSYYSYEWQDDFAAAKNFALDKAGCDWIVFLDADERLQYPEGIKGNLLRLLDKHPDTEAVLAPLENIDADNNDMLIDTGRVIRIFRRKPDLCYVGAVHEQLRSKTGDADREPLVAEADVLFTVRHTGYSTGVIQKKLRRNLALVLREMSEGNKELYYGHLAACYYGLGAYQPALDNALLAIASPYQPIDRQAGAYWLALEAMQELGYLMEDKLAVAEAALTVAGDIPDFYGYKGCILAENKQWKQAAFYLTKAEEIYADCQTGDGLMPVGSSRYVQLVDQCRTALAKCHVRLGELALGRQEYIQVLTANKWYDEALVHYLDSFGRRRGEIPVEAAQVFLTVYSEETDRRMLCDWLKRHGYAWQEMMASYDEEKPAVVRDILTDLAMQVQFLFVSLLNAAPDFASHLVREQLKLLPSGLASLVYYFHGKKEGWGNVEPEELAGAAISREAYDSMKNAVNIWGTEAARKRFEEIGRELNGEAKAR